MTERLSGKVIIVTGAGSGIGRAAARMFAREGASVAAFDINAEAVAAVVESIRADGGHADALTVDVTDEAQVSAGIAQVVTQHGRLDGVFNVAGGSGRRAGDAPAHAATLAGWDYTLRLNLTSIFLMCKYALAPMLAQRSGALVNLSSVLGLAGSADFATHAYAAAKGGIISLSRSMAVYYAPHGIRVNVIAPGLIDTAMSQRAQQDAGVMALIPRMQPLTGSLGTADDVAGAALYLLSDEAKFVTGVTLSVDGGWMAQ